MKKRFFALAFAAILSASVAPGAAFGASLPYVTDANPAGNGYTITIEVAGNENMQVLMHNSKTGKRVKVDKIGRHVFMARIKAGKTYTIKARGDKKAWKAITYGIAKPARQLRK